MFKSKKTVGLFLAIGITFFMAGCFPDTPVVPAPTATITPAPTVTQEEEILIGPAKEEVLAMRETVLEGMDQNAIDRLTENIKIANLTMEEAYLYDDLFGKLEIKSICTGIILMKRKKYRLEWRRTERQSLLTIGLMLPILLN